MTIPPPLVQGSTIGITCPAGFVAPDRVKHAVTTLQQWGYHVIIGNTVRDRDLYMSGTDEERLADLQQMIDNPLINAIIMGRGGYGMSRIIDQIDLSAIITNPKWICGFSDITVLHNHLHTSTQLATMHAPMCGAFKPETDSAEYILAYKSLLRGSKYSYNIDPHPLNRHGIATATLTGGNLSILAHLTGSCSEVNTDGKILFIEDIGEYLYSIDRLMLNLKRAGKLNNLAALLVGDFNDLQDTAKPFGMSYQEIIAEKVANFKYPVCFNFRAGHLDVNYPFVLGGEHHLEIGPEKSTLTLL